LLSNCSKPVKLSAVAINEDNHEDKTFTQLAKGTYRICYASPECLLHNPRFKKLFRHEDFRRKIVAMVVDEAHVIEAWKTEFRKDYGELETLKIIMGNEIPWLALTGTCSTKTFETIYQTLGMGGTRRFYGLDCGSDRPNLALWVRSMEYPASSLHDLLAFVPISPQCPSDFPKSIFYFKTRQLSRRACDLVRSVVDPEFRKYLYAFTAVNSEEYKEEIMLRLRKGLNLRWLFATIAAGMGMDIPDIEVAVIFGVDAFESAFQKGGRAGRDPDLKAKMIWIVEPWAFETMSTEPSKKYLADAKRRDNMDPASREYINRSQSSECMRSYAITHLRPTPNLPGFPWFKPQNNLDWDEDENVSSVTWEVVDQEIAKGGDCGCSSLVCREDPNVAVGVLSEAERQIISHHLRTRASQGLTMMSMMSESISPVESGPLRCSRAEKDILHQALRSWRDTYWAKIRADYPFFSRDWVITDENIRRLVEKAHVLLNSPSVDVATVRDIIRCISDEATLTSLVLVLREFCDKRRERDLEEANTRCAKRGRPSQTVHSQNDDPFLDSYRQMSTPGPSSRSSIVQWQLQSYSHQRSVDIIVLLVFSG
jgi:hypothetical protein